MWLVRTQTIPPHQEHHTGSDPHLCQFLRVVEDLLSLRPVKGVPPGNVAPAVLSGPFLLLQGLLQQGLLRFLPLLLGAGTPLGLRPGLPDFADVKLHFLELDVLLVNVRDAPLGLLATLRLVVDLGLPLHGRLGVLRVELVPLTKLALPRGLVPKR